MKKTFAVVAAAAAVAVLPSPVHAHIGVETSDPANAATLAQAPDLATITFNADVDIETAAAQLRWLGGTDTPIEDATRRDVRTEELPLVSADDRTAVFDLPKLESGLYAIDWAVNEAGGHDNSSFILFKVADEDSAPTVWILTGGAIAVVLVALTILRRRKDA